MAKVAPQVGFEPTTHGLTVHRSNQLSYWGIDKIQTLRAGLAPQVGFEPTTHGLTVHRSNQLSYWGTAFNGAKY
jgi:hypothetical protein